MCNYLCCFLLGCCCLVALEEQDAAYRQLQLERSMMNTPTKIFLISVEKNGLSDGSTTAAEILESETHSK